MCITFIIHSRIVLFRIRRSCSSSSISCSLSNIWIKLCRKRVREKTNNHSRRVNRATDLLILCIIRWTRTRVNLSQTVFIHLRPCISYSTFFLSGFLSVSQEPDEFYTSFSNSAPIINPSSISHSSIKFSSQTYIIRYISNCYCAHS